MPHELSKPIHYVECPKCGENLINTMVFSTDGQACDGGHVIVLNRHSLQEVADKLRGSE